MPQQNKIKVMFIVACGMIALTSFGLVYLVFRFIDAIATDVNILMH